MNERMIQPGRALNLRPLRLAIVLIGIVVGQFLLYGPSMVGRKFLLPLDCLMMSGRYMPDTAETPAVFPHNFVAEDIMLQFEPDRRFTRREIAAGRFPFWMPAQYGGVPFLAPKYSPFFLLTCLTASPAMLAWAQLLAAGVAGMGAYAFCRRVIRVSYWPAALVAWCYPMTGFFIFWQGNWGPAAAYWLPWLLFAVDRTVRGARLAPVALAAVTGLVLVSGHADVAALVLLVSGLFALWCLYDVHGLRLFQSRTRKAVLRLACGGGLGLLLGSPNILPVLEYAGTGFRMEQRFAGHQERPPVGLAAFSHAMLPDMYGTSEKGSILLPPKGEVNLPESSAAAYAGILAALVAAPLAWFSRRHRSMNVFWVVLAVFGMGWCLNLPGFVQILSLLGINMLSYNRLVFATSFAILAMTAIGLDALIEGQIQWHTCLWSPVVLLAGLLMWCVYRSNVLPEPLATQLGISVQEGHPYLWITDLNGWRQAQAWFELHYRMSAALCGAGIIAWLLLRFRLLNQRSLVAVIGVMMLADLLWFSYGRSAQCDRSLDFPEIPALRELANAAPGRVMGYCCFPANLAEAVGLSDARGYDAVDPARWVTLLKTASEPGPVNPVYAVIQWVVPRGRVIAPNTMQLTPVLDLLGVRYVIFRGEPPSAIKPRFQSPDYWILENQFALARVFVPKRVEVVPDNDERLRKLSLPDFKPREIAYVEAPVNLPADCSGDVRIKEETPTRIIVAAQMETAGLLVLADRWDAGWKASVNGSGVPILITNHALRGVVVPSGPSTIEFRYQPASVRMALSLASCAVIVLLGWSGSTLWLRRPGGTAL